jgi:hypothetical protein
MSDTNAVSVLESRDKKVIADALRNVQPQTELGARWIELSLRGLEAGEETLSADAPEERLDRLTETLRQMKVTNEEMTESLNEARARTIRLYFPNLEMMLREDQSDGETLS